MLHVAIEVYGQKILCWSDQCSEQNLYDWKKHREPHTEQGGMMLSL